MCIEDFASIAAVTDLEDQEVMRKETAITTHSLRSFTAVLLKEREV